MEKIELVLTRIGNSRGVRLPASVLKKYRVEKTLILEERPGEIVLHPKRKKGGKLSWEKTFLQTASENEDWSEWDVALKDGLRDL